MYWTFSVLHVCRLCMGVFPGSENRFVFFSSLLAEAKINNFSLLEEEEEDSVAGCSMPTNQPDSNQRQYTKLRARSSDLNSPSGSEHTWAGAKV